MHLRPGRPVALAVGLPLLADLAARALALPPQLDLVLWLLTPALSGWCAWLVLARDRFRAELCLLSWAIAALLVLELPAEALRVTWPALPLLARLASVAAQLGAARVLWRSSRAATPVDSAALALLSGDLVSLLGPAGLVPGPWAIATAQAGLVAAAVLALAKFNRRVAE